MSIVRGEMRHLGRVPHRVMGRDAFAFLDDLARQAANTELHAWYSSATEASPARGHRTRALSCCHGGDNGGSTPPRRALRETTQGG